MKAEKDPRAKEGMRIRMVSMVDDPNPVPMGTEGTINFIDDMGTIHVKWDDGRLLGVIPSVDRYQLLEAETIKQAISQEPTRVKRSMPNVKITRADGSPTKVSGVKIKGVTDFMSDKKKKKSKKEEEVKTETTMAAGGASTGAYVGPMGATKPMWGKGPLTTKEGIKETTIARDSKIDDTSFEAWADKNNDGWWWNDNPTIEGGEIVDPLAKIKTTWDDDVLDVSRDWGKSQTLKKEDLFRMVQNRLTEAKKEDKRSKVHTKKWDDCVEAVKKQNTERGTNYKPEAVCTSSIGYEGSIKKSHRKKEEIEETTTFGSALGADSPVGPAFAAKQGQWKASKKTIYPGGKIVQKIDNSGILNPVNEANTVKSHPGGKFVKIKKKCTRFPYCNQGAIDNPLDLSNEVKGDGNYVEEQLMRNIHEVAKETGKTFDEVYSIIKNNLKK